jgi:predicted murein hydrolase (TIGR00659 family)
MTPAVGVDFLVASPLLWLTLTLGAYLAATMVSRRFGKPPVLNPTLWSIVAIVLVLVATSTPYRRYFEGAQFVHFLLGPAVVALAVPLYRHTALIRKSAKAVAGGLVVGTFSAILSGVLVVRLLGGGHDLWVSMAPKSATAAIAMAISERLGGIPPLTAVLTIATGILGAVFGSAICRLVRVRDWPARGFAMGLTSHGIATARAFQEHEIAGTFAALAMALNGLATALATPAVIGLLANLG